MTYIERKFIYYTECQLATLEQLTCRKSSSQSDIRRQKSIADGMLRCLIAIDNLDTDEMRGELMAVPRVKEWLASESDAGVES
jgi:hypothetical protein